MSERIKDEVTLGNLIYGVLDRDENEIRDKAYIADIVSHAIIQAGYLSPEEVKAERERVPPVLSDKAVSEMHLGFHVPTKKQWALKQDHQYWRDRQLLTAQRDFGVEFMKEGER